MRRKWQSAHRIIIIMFSVDLKQKAEVTSSR